MTAGILFFDTETNGLWKNAKGPLDPEQPDIVQFAGVITDADLNVVFSIDTLVYQHKPVPPEAVNVHGVTMDRSKDFGMSIAMLMTLLDEMSDTYFRCIAHNIAYDSKVVRRAAKLCNLPDPFEGKEMWCTMKASKDVIKDKTGFGKGGYKLPSLNQVYRHFFNEDIQGAHNAMNDVLATISIYRELCSHWKIQ